MTNRSLMKTMHRTSRKEMYFTYKFKVFFPISYTLYIFLYFYYSQIIKVVIKLDDKNLED